MKGVCIAMIFLSVVHFPKSLSYKTCVYNERIHILNCENERWDKIPYDQFQNKKTVILNLSHNNISTIEDKFFEIASRNFIREIYLNNNQISSLPLHLFHGLPSLKTLDLANNSLTTVPRRFCHMSALETLVLDGNPIVNVSKNVFTCLRGLKYLSLANCKLEYLPENFAEDLELEEINLEGNHITNIHEVKFLPGVKVKK